MPNVVVKDNHLTFGGVAYFRGHAEEVEIGSIGEKRTPLTKQNYLEVKDRIPVPKIDIAKATTVEIDWSRTNKNAFDANVSAIIKGIPVGLDANDTFKKLRNDDLKLVKFSVSNNAMERAINNAPRKREDLVRWGKNARVAHQIFVVIEAETAQALNRAGSVNLSAGMNDVVEVSVDNSYSTSGYSKVRLSAGTTFAYLLAKFDWDAKLKKNRDKVVDLDDDQWSLN